MLSLLPALFTVLLALQWHLREMQVEEAWAGGSTGLGIQIGLIDDGTPS